MTNNLSNMLRLYYQCNYAGDYELLSMKVSKDQQTTVAPIVFNNPGTRFVECQIDNKTFHILKIIPMDVASINGLALKAANDHNFMQLNGPKNEVTEKHAREYKVHAQQVVDRMLEYGADFEKQFNELIAKFPIPPTEMPKGIKVIG